MYLISKHLLLNEINYYGQRSNTITEESNTIVKQDKPEEPKQREWLRPLWFLFTVGWYITLSLIIPTGIGYWQEALRSRRKQTSGKVDHYMSSVHGIRKGVYLSQISPDNGCVGRGCEILRNPFSMKHKAKVMACGD